MTNCDEKIDIFCKASYEVYLWKISQLSIHGDIALPKR